MRRASIHLVLCAAALAAPATATMAMGFGRSGAASALGQTLDFSTVVLLEGDEELAPSCVFAEVTAGENRLAPAAVRVALEPSVGPRQRLVRVTTTVRIDEPIVAVDVSLGCTSRMSRRFVAFVDPPQIRLAQADAELPPAPRTDARPAPRADAGPTARNSERARRVADTGPGTGGTGVPLARSRQRRAEPSPVTPPQVLARARGAGVPRLQLEAPPLRSAPPASAPTPVTPSMPAAEPLVAAAAPASDAEAALQGERERIQLLEAGLARLRADAQATQQTVGALQARLRQAESDRYSNGLVYGLAGAAALFAALAALFWWLRPRQRRRARWFDAAAKQARAAAPPAGRSAAAAPSRPAPVTASETSASWRGSMSSGLAATAPATIGGLEVTTVLGPESTRAGAGADAAGAAGTGARGAELSMEELIDLEQQAEFFVVLGQDEAAIELLAAHVRSDGGKSPLPYLQLLEIHRRRDDEAAFERVRHAFRQRFDSAAPDWNDDLQAGRALDGYPQALARVQAVWATPMHAMQTLEGLLFRRSAGDETFDFAACRELLFLYSIARDLAEHVDTDFGPIDLFLPLEDAPAEAIATLPSTLPPDSGAHTIDLDVSRWPDAPSEELVIVRSPGRRGG